MSRERLEKLRADIEPITWRRIFPNDKPTGHDLAVFYKVIGYIKRTLIEAAIAEQPEDIVGTAHLPWLNGRVDGESLATIFMGRHVESLSKRLSKAEFDAIRDDLGEWLTEQLPDVRLAEQPEDDGLDVVRLRLVLSKLASNNVHDNSRYDSGDYGILERPSEFANRIAAEYAALSPVSPSEEREP